MTEDLRALAVRAVCRISPPSCDKHSCALAGDTGLNKTPPPPELHVDVIEKRQKYRKSCFGARPKQCPAALILNYILCARYMKRDGQYAPLIGVLMGSTSDWDVMQHACEVLKEFGVRFETRVVSAHRTPDEMFSYAEEARARGLKAIIAGAGGAAHLPGMLASKTLIPVLGVPIPSKYLRGEDSLLSIVQMPRGVPVATFAIGEAGAANAALFALEMLSTQDSELATALAQYRATQNEKARNMTLPL